MVCVIQYDVKESQGPDDGKNVRCIERISDRGHVGQDFKRSCDAQYQVVEKEKDD
jgi:hypothetical protein